jgi:hypothetical protein
MRSRVLAASAVVLSAALAWLWRSPEPAPHQRDTTSLAAAPLPPASIPAVSVPTTTPGERRLPQRNARGEDPPLLTPAGPLRLAATVAQTDGADHEPDDTPRPLTGHPERIRKLLRWAARDPGAAALWADRRHDPAERREALQAVCFKVAEQDPRGAMDMAEAYGLDDGLGVAENLIAQWSAVDAEAALDWVAQRPPGDARDELLARVAFVRSAADPAHAARLIEEAMSPGSLQEEAAASVVLRWSAQDAPAAAAWAEGLPPGTLRDRARQELARLGGHPPR